MNSLINDFIAFAHELSDASGEVIRPYFGAHGTVDAKADQSPVTKADREAEEIMRSMISTRYPDHGIYGEEFGESLNARRIGKAESRKAEGVNEAKGVIPPSHYTWLIDPIDGTRAFIAGKKEWGTLICLCENGIPILGVMNQPVTSERWVGVLNQPTTYNGEPIRTHTCNSLASASISTTSRNHFTPPQAAQFVKLAQQCAEIIEDGDCYAYGLLASGQRDIVVDAGLKPYDILALVPIIKGAGGQITSWDGTPISLQYYSCVIASGDKRAHALSLAEFLPQN